MRKSYTDLKCICRFAACLTIGFWGAFFPGKAQAQCPPISISATDTFICAGDSTTLTILTSALDTGDVSTPVINNNGQDGNMFNITATNEITIRYFEGNIANTPSVTTDYYIYYKVGTHVGFENNAGAWTLVAGPISFNPNAPNTFTRIPYLVNITIPAGQTYAFYLTNTSAISNNNRYHNGATTGAVLSSNTDLTVYEGTGGAYPFGTFFNARPWEGRVIYAKAPDFAWSTGATSQSITVAPSTATSYVGTASYSALGCSSLDTFLVNVSQGGGAVNLGADTTLCQSTLVLDAGAGGVSYAWSTGGSSQTIAVTASGTYSAAVLDSAGCGSEDTIVVTMNPLPGVTVGADFTRCENDPCSPLSAVVTGAPGPFTYLWSPSQGLDDETLANPCANPGTTTTYSLQVGSSDGCFNLPDTSSAVVVSVNPSPVSQLPSDTSFCIGSSVQLDAGSGFTAYAWSTSGNTQSIVVSSVGAYSVTLTNALNCSASDTVNVTELPAPVASFTESPNGLVVAFTNSSSNATSSFWDFGDGQTGTAANPSHTYTTNGAFTVTLIVTNACGSDTTTSTIVVTGLETNGLAANVHVFPNPGNGLFNFRVDGLIAANADLAITSVMGELVAARSLGALNGKLELELQLTDLASGVYFLRFTADGTTIVKKLVIR